jgi:hypothetical protein
MMLVGGPASAPASVKVVRRAEWIIFAFLLYTPALTLLAPAPTGLRMRLALLRSAVVLIYVGLVVLGSAKPA